MTENKRFDSVLYAVADKTKNVLNRLSPTVKCNTNEIRMRAGLPLALTVGTETVFVRENGQTQFFLSKDLYKVTEQELEESFKKLCNSSVFAHESELANGYIVMKNGCRAGVCGHLTKNGTMKDVSSLNLRIAKEVFGCANEIISTYKNGGLLIAGPPGSGKTTILRDLVRQLSDGINGRLNRIVIVDSRQEISGSSCGKATNDIGSNSDVIITHSKAEGIEIALRTMFPDIIAFDEIATAAELAKVSESFCAGVKIITTAHAGNMEELCSRSVTSALLKSGAISQVAMLPRLHGDKIRIFDTKEFSSVVAV